MATADRTAVASDPPRPEGSGEALGLAETTASGGGAIVTAATLRSDGPRPVLGALPAAIGRYQVIRSLGAGGMGEVVLARDPELDRKVAIKLLRAGRGAGEAQVRLLREAQAMARLSHPNVVQIHDVGVTGDRVFLAMELVEGVTLAQWLAERRRSWREVVRVFVDAGRGLAAAHAAGLVHRDFKPDNVLLGADGRARVADFGLARGERGDEGGRVDNFGERPLLVHTLTATGVVMGTPMYMSPEQHLGEPAGPASDVFSFSVALYEGLYAARPFAGDTMVSLAASVLGGTVSAPPAGHAVPGWLDAVVRRGLARAPEERWPDFSTLLAALDRDPQRTRRRWALGVGSVIGAAALGATLQARSAAAELCTGGEAAIAEVWDAAVEARIRGAAGERVAGGLDAYAAGWTAMHADACREHQRGETSAGLLDARMRCLEQRRQGLAEAVTVIGAGDAGVLREAPAVVAKLMPRAGCADAEALTREVPPPTDPGVAAAVADVHHRLARARVLADAGRPEQALQVVTAARREAEGLGYAPTVAAAWLAEGRAAFDAQAMSAAGDAFAAAFVAATAAGDDAVAAEARARELFVEGVYGERAGEALAAGPHAEALVARLGGRGDLAALLANNLGVLRLIQGDPAAARGQFARALAVADPRIDPIDRAWYLANAAQVAEDRSERTGLFDQATALLDGALGPAHPTALALTVTRANQADPRVAAELLTAAMPHLTAGRESRPMLCADVLFILGHALDELGRGAEAGRALAEAERCLDVAIAPEQAEPVAATRRLIGGLRRVVLGEELAAAAAELTAAAEAFAPHAAVPDVAMRVADARLLAAQVHLARGDDAAARPLLEQALATFDAAPPQLGWLPRLLGARARVALAGVLVRAGGDRGRALALLAAAEEVYRAEGTLTAGLEAVEAVRAAAR